MSSSVHILENINDIPPHSPGFWRDELVNVPAQILVTATGAIVTAASAPTVTAAGVSVDNTETFVLRVVVPGDYAPDSHDGDGLKLRFLCSAATSGTLAVTSATLHRAASAAVGSLLTLPTALAARTVDNIVSEMVEFDLSGMGLAAGDVVDVLITGTNSSTDEIIINGGWIRYKSIWVLATESERTP